MASYNRVILMGNLTKDPEVRYTPSGTAVCDLRMATNRRFRGADGQDREETCFVNVTVWGRQAENTGKYLGRGSSALVEGRLKYDEWERDGQKHNRLSVVAERIQFLGSPRNQELRDTPPDPQAAPRQAAPPAPQPAAPQPPMPQTPVSQPPASGGQPAPAPPPVQDAAPPADFNDTADDDNLPF